MADWDLLPVEKKIPYEVSRARSQRVLLDPEEMNSLFQVLGSFFLFRTATKNELPAQDDRTEWRLLYEEYIEQLKLGDVGRAVLLSAFIAPSKESFYALSTPSKKIQIRPREPIIQITHHTFSFNPEEGQFYSQIFGAEALSWGVEWSFPLLFEEPFSKEVFKLTDAERWPALLLFKKWEGWLREHTEPVKFLSREKKEIAPFRIGKKAKSWAKELPALHKKGLTLL